METLRDVPGLPESRLPEQVLAQLPVSTPAPPWECRVRAVLWVQRATLAGSPRFRGLALGALVEYLDAPVGPYREVFAGPLLRGSLLPVVHVPFIAVDSLPSLHGGRAHWALPKALASFSPDGRTATGDTWSVTVDPQPYGPRLPLVGPLLAQQDARRTVVSLRGRGRLARVHVTATGPTLSGWLGTGTRTGVVAEGRMVVGPPR